MASALSEEEFHRIQAQLIDLRSANYSLDEKCHKQLNEIATLVDRYDVLDKNYQKAQKALTKSKKAKDVELLLQENQTLQLKLQSQEEEFQLQNMTMMQELSMLVSSNEKLENELKRLREHRIETISSDDNRPESEETCRLDETLLKLRAENTTLQKNMSSIRSNYEEEIARLRESLREMSLLFVDMEARSEKHETSRDSLYCSRSLQNTDGDDSDIIEVGSEEVSYHKSPNGSVMDVVRQAEERVAILEKQVKEYQDLKLQFETEREEKELLREQLESARSTSENQSTNLHEEMLKLKDKLKKKQESLLQLQVEKELMYMENKKSFEELQAAKEQEIHQFKEQAQRLQMQLNSTTQNLIEYKEKTNETIGILESQLSQKQAEVNGQSAEKLLELEATRIVLETQLTEAKLNITNISDELKTLNGKCQELTATNDDLESRLKAVEESQNELLQNLVEMSNVAEKRKSLLDEMAIHLQKKTDEHQQEVLRMTKEYSDKITELAEKFEEEKIKSSELEETKVKLEDSETQVQSLQCTKGWFERRLNEMETTLESTKCHYESLLSQKNESHAIAFTKLNDEQETRLKDLHTELEICSAQKTECEETIQRLRQEAKDGIEDRKIHEKKGASIMKDLRRQLQMERKRAEKLQERLQEVLNDPNQMRSIEAFKPPGDVGDRAETSSISSWSLMSGGQLECGSKESAQGGSGNCSVVTNGNSPTPPSVLEQENNDLLCRITSLQEEKWILEEKVNHLEESNSAMADDLVQKQGIIQYYCMEGRSDRSSHLGNVDKLTVKRVVDFIKDKGDENQREINRRLLRTLEETLTKNMCLQKDLEMLSQEIVRLNADSNGSISCIDLSSSVNTEMFTSVDEYH